MKKVIYILIFCIVTFGLFFSINNHSILSTFAEEKQNTKKYSYENRFLSKVSSILGVEKSDLSKAIKQAKKEIMDENLHGPNNQIKSGQIFQDVDNNVTRFLIMSKKISLMDINEKDLMTTLVFQVRSIPAALYKSLGGLASNGINITKLESYVHPQGFDVAQFYIDFEGHPEQNSVKLALEEMKFFCNQMTILGVYKKSDFRKK